MVLHECVNKDEASQVCTHIQSVMRATLPTCYQAGTAIALTFLEASYPAVGHTTPRRHESILLPRRSGSFNTHSAIHATQ